MWKKELILPASSIDSHDGTVYKSRRENEDEDKAGSVTSRSLPEHYPSNEGEYVDGVAYVADGMSGYWECDLSKDAAEYVLNWLECHPVTVDVAGSSPVSLAIFILNGKAAAKSRCIKIKEQTLNYLLKCVPLCKCFPNLVSPC